MLITAFFSLMIVVEICTQTLIVGALFWSAYGIFLPLKFIILIAVLHAILLYIANIFLNNKGMIVKHCMVGIGVLLAVDLLNIVSLAKYTVGTVAVEFSINIIMYVLILKIKNNIKK